METPNRNELIDEAVVDTTSEKPKKMLLSAPEKKLALFKARTVLSVYGTMEERRICKSQIKRMTRELNERQ